MIELPKATVVRLPRYLRLLEDLESKETVSSEELAEAAGANAANVRRDLSHLDFHGVRGVGYSVADLKYRIRQELGIADRRQVAIIGAGNLGRALAAYGGLSRRGFDVAAVYDTDTRKVGSKAGRVEVRNLQDMDSDCRGGCFDMAILAVPAVAAQQVTDRLVDLGNSVSGDKLAGDVARLNAGLLDSDKLPGSEWLRPPHRTELCRSGSDGHRSHGPNH